MVQLLPFIVLNMDLALKFTCINRGFVDRESLFADSEKFWFYFFSNLSSKRFCSLIRWFTTIDMRCKPWNLEGSLENLRVLWSWTKTFRIRVDLHQPRVCCCSWTEKKVSMRFIPGFNRRFELKSLKTLWNWFCLLISGLNPNVNR